MVMKGGNLDNSLARTKGLPNPPDTWLPQQTTRIFLCKVKGVLRPIARGDAES